MIKVIVSTSAGSVTDLFPEHTALRDVLESVESHYADTDSMVYGKCIKPEDMDKSLRDFARDSIVRLTIGVKSEKEDPGFDELPGLVLSPVVDPSSFQTDKVKEIQDVITALAKWLWGKLIRFLPLFLATYGIVILVMTILGGAWNYKFLFGAVTVLLICSNLIWFGMSEEKRRKGKNGSDQKMDDREQISCENTEEHCFVKVETDELPF